MGKGGDKSSALGRSRGVKRENFHYSNSEEPHVIRRKQILEKHPEIETLYGYDIRPALIAPLIIGSQIALSYYTQLLSFPLAFLVCWLYGGAASHSLSLLTHELSHNLVLPTPKMNELFGILCNVGMGFPSSTMFKRYHMEHHQFQGDHDRDVDLPTQWEGRFFTNTFLKCIWLLCQPLFYALRPGIVRPKSYRPIDIFNVISIALSDMVVFHFFGWKAVAYLMGSTLLGMGFHPCAGHFIAEHYIFTEGQETYSYYGSLNLLCWNVGYHNEHHDFPRVPGFRLPMVTNMAPEFYSNLKTHKSWTMVLYNFLTDPSIGPYSRIIRVKTTPGLKKNLESSDRIDDEVYNGAKKGK